MQDFESALKKLGLSDKEARVYLGSLKLGRASATQLAREAGVNRATTYAIIEELKKEGLMSSFEQEKKTYFVAESPERLRHLFQVQEQKLKEGFQNLGKILPGLEELYEARGERARVRFFEGEAGIAAIREDILRTKTDRLDQIVPLVEETKPPSLEIQHRPKLTQFKAERRTIYTSRQGAILPLKDGLAQRKYMPHGDFPIEAEIILYGNRAAIITTKKKIIGVILEDAAIVKTFQLIFDIAWKCVK